MSNFKPTTMVKDNFFQRPVGAAVLYLNDFHFGRNLDVLNRAARLVPSDVKGFASLVANAPNISADSVQDIIDQLVKWADEAENAEQ